VPDRFVAVVAVVALPALLAVQAVQVPVRLVITPDAGVPRAGVTNVGEVANTIFPVPVAPLGVTPAIEMSVPNVCSAVHVLAFPRFRATVTLPVVVGIDTVPLAAVTELTAPEPDPHADPLLLNVPEEFT